MQNGSQVIERLLKGGGVGKTTTTLFLGAALAGAGQRVLLVDNDPQASLTRVLGVGAEAGLTIGLTTAALRLVADLRSRWSGPEKSTTAGRRPTRPGRAQPFEVRSESAICVAQASSVLAAHEERETGR